MTKAITLLGTAEIARICGVDIKTIHNWGKRGDMPHFRSPGGHMRFKPEEIVPWLAKIGYTIPEELRRYMPAEVEQPMGYMQGRGAS